MLTEHHINPERCTACGLCVHTCPSRIYNAGNPVTINDDNKALCFLCGQCCAVCPTDAIRIDGLEPRSFVPVADNPVTPEALEQLMLQRRSVRNFTDKQVASELLEKVVAAAGLAPMGFPPTGVEVTVLSSRDLVAQLLPEGVKMVQELNKLTRNGFGRWMLQRMVGPRIYRMMVDELLPLMKPALQEYNENGLDFICWGAPALLIFHVGPETTSRETEVVIASTYAMLMAQSLGLGNVMLGMAAATLARSKKLRDQFGIPMDHEILNTLALGWPAFPYQRGIRRELHKVHSL